jgi:hypothetical protein
MHSQESAKDANATQSDEIQVKTINREYLTRLFIVEKS